jgi:hypothetical protein
MGNRIPQSERAAVRLQKMGDLNARLRRAVRNQRLSLMGFLKSVFSGISFGSDQAVRAGQHRVISGNMSALRQIVNTLTLFAPACLDPAMLLPGAA